MRILLIYPKTEIWNTPTQMPLGLAYLAAVLEKDGHSVEIFDQMVEEQSLEEKIKISQFDLVGISANTPLIKGAWEVAKIVKKFSEAKVVLGGPHPTSLPKESLNKNFIDVIIRGEGEETIVELCQKISQNESLEDILGISYKKNNQIVHNPPRHLIKDLDSLPFPAYHLFKIDKYSVTQPLKSKKTKGSRAFYIMTSRGCPFGCIYCYKGIYGRTFRARSPQNVIAEWKHLVNDLRATEIGVQDDIFNLNKKRALEICHLLVKEKLNKIPWITNNGIRADHTDLELLKAMKEAGCKRVGFGVESGSQKILDIIKKNSTLDQFRKVFTEAKKIGLETMSFFMFGNPGEDSQTMEQTIKFAQELDPDIAHFSITTPFPGTPLYNLVEKEGKFLIKDWSQYGILEGKAYFEIGNLKSEIVEQKWHQAYRRFYLRPRRVLKEMINLDNWLNIKNLARAGWKYFIK